MSEIRKPGNQMRHQSETSGVPVNAPFGNARALKDAHEEIDLDRIVWDWEYRDDVLKTLRTHD
jgi:hypothetical protein